MRIDLIEALIDNTLEYSDGLFWYNYDLAKAFAKYSGLRSKKTRHIKKRAKKEIMKALKLGLEELKNEN